MNPYQSLRLLVLAAVATGCGTPREVPPGTEGVVRADGVPLADVQVQIYRQEPTPLGSGITDSDGRFQLRLPGLSGPLHVQPGDYRFTVESAGAIYLSWPPEFSDPKQTPLQASITADQRIIELDVPIPSVKY